MLWGLNFSNGWRDTPGNYLHSHLSVKFKTTCIVMITNCCRAEGSQASVNRWCGHMYISNAYLKCHISSAERPSHDEDNL